MARQRRGGGFRPPELPLRGTLGTLLRTAAAQVGPLRDALERTAREGLREGRERLDEALAARSAARSPSRSATRSPSRSSSRSAGSRRRASSGYDDALSDLGAIVLDLIRQGEIDLAELPEVRDIVAHLDELDDVSSLHDDHDDHDDHENHDEEIASPPSRNRFDARRRDPSRHHDDAAPADDGTVSSKTFRPRPSASSSAAASPSRASKSAPPARVWRPPLDNDDAAPPPAADDRAPRTRSVPRPKDPLRKGGISFDDDDDLADYMHPDDVPPKPPKDGDS